MRMDEVGVVARRRGIAVRRLRRVLHIARDLSSNARWISLSFRHLKGPERRRTFCNDSVELEFDSVSDMNERMNRSRQRSHQHLTLSTQQILLQHRHDARFPPCVRRRRSRRRRDRFVKEGEEVGV